LYDNSDNIIITERNDERQQLQSTTVLPVNRDDTRLLRSHPTLRYR
jgi:hypothetical protein